MRRTPRYGAALLLVLIGCPAMAAELLPGFAQRYSLSRAPAGCDAALGESSPMERPISCLLAGPGDAEDYFDPELLRLSSPPMRSESGRRGKGPVLLNLTENWLAAVNYHHAPPPALAPARDLRTSRYSATSSEADRDILDLKLKWTLWRNEVDLGYQLQSTRADDDVAGRRYSVWRLIGSEDQLHGVSIGFTRRFGRTD